MWPPKSKVVNLMLPIASSSEVGCQVGCRVASLSFFNMWSNVVLPALSRPRNKSLPCLFHSPSEDRISLTNNKYHLLVWPLIRKLLCIQVHRKLALIPWITYTSQISPTLYLVVFISLDVWARTGSSRSGQQFVYKFLIFKFSEGWSKEFTLGKTRGWSNHEYRTFKTWYTRRMSLWYMYTV